METLTIFGRTLSFRQIRTGLFALAGMIFLLQAFNLTWPKVQEYLDLRGQIAQHEQELKDAQAVTQTAAQVHARLARVQENLEALRNRFPSRQVVLSTLLIDLSHIFKESHVTLSNFQPKEYQPLGNASLKDLGKISVEITARGSYPSLILLFDQLSRYERVLTVEAPSFVPAGTSEGFGNDLTTTFTLTTYALAQ